jgi:cobalt-zinc-cadmium efflux system membrane fusion protein
MLARPVVAILICLTAAISACGHKTDSANASTNPPETAAVRSPFVTLPAGSPKLRQIRVEPIQLVEVPTDEVIAPGSLEVNPSRVSRVMLPLSGRVTAVMAALGDSVEHGQPLAAIESPDAETAESLYLQSESSCTQARAAVVKTQADFDRASDLFEHDAVAKKEVLNAQNALAQAQGSLTQAEAGREQAMRRLKLLGLDPGTFGQKVLIRAPISGKILTINVVAGEFRNDTNAPLMTVADLSTLWASSDVPEAYIRFCRLGGVVQVELIAFPGERFMGRVTHISDTLDPQTRTVKVRAELNNSSGRFRPEMYGRIRYSEIKKPMLLLDERSVYHHEGKTLVFIEQAPGRFMQREVSAGRRVGDKFIVESGLKPGDRVVVEGIIYLMGGV